MRKFVVAPLSVAVAAFLLAGCGTSTSSSAGSSTAASSSAVASGSAAAATGAPAPAATVVTGTVSVANQGISVTAQAKLELSLVDVTQQPGVTINKQDFNPPTFPQAFRIPFTSSAINPNDIYVLQATMHDNGRTWTTKLQQPVLTHGTPAKVDLTLVAEPTAAEKMLADFQNAKRQTGGMKVKNSTSKRIGESHSWQVFSDIHGVEFIIEQVNQADKGFTKTEYAFHGGLPWVVVRDHMPKPGAAASMTEKAGWNEKGLLVLQQRISGGKTTTLSKADATDLQNQAVAEYKKFSRHRR